MAIGHNIVQRLARDLLALLGKHLSRPGFDPELLVIDILHTLSKPVYVKQLLFRDFEAAPEDQWCSYPGMPRLHCQAFVYHQVLLLRPLTLAQHLNDSPSNMHKLLAALCRFGPDPRWGQADIKRDPAQSPTGEGCPFFQPVAVALTAKRTRLGEQFSDISKSRRTQYGPLWLTAEGCAAEAPEELTLMDVLEILPKPLAPAFTDDPQVQKLFLRVLEALNERYMLLRSCGLDPEQWLDRPEFSINNLKDLKQLRRRARDLLRTGQTQDLYKAYQRAFSELQDKRKTLAGYSDFDEFARSEAGRIMLGRFDRPLAESSGDEPAQEEPLRLDLAGAAGLEEEAHFERQILGFMQNDPELRADPILRHYFHEVIGRERSLDGPEGVLKDPDFQARIRADPRYSGLDDSELAKRLWDRLRRLIGRYLDCEDDN